MKDVSRLTLTEAAVRFRERSLSATDLTQSYLDKIAEKDKGIHAFLEVFQKDALNQARTSEKRFEAKEPRSVLEGIPVAVKDNILVSGCRTTAGSRILEPYCASYDATVIDRLRKAGAVLLGKTNLDEFAMGSSTEHSAFGPTRNPLELSRVPGGSSGGSAAAVAADFCLAALGSDTGGSIRQPAAFCGIAGLKPTYGRVSRFGLIALASSLDQIGPMGKTIEDVEAVFSVISGYDARDATTYRDDRIPNPATSFRDFGDLQGLRVGLPKEYFGEGLDARIRAEINRAVSVLERAGAETKEISLPHTPYALAVYYLVMPSEASANLARFDGVRYGSSVLRTDADLRGPDADLRGREIPRQSAKEPALVSDFWSVYFETRKKYFGEEAKRRIMLGTFALSAGYYDAYYARAQKVRSLIKKDFERAFSEVDVLMTPTSPTLPFRFGEKSEDPLAMYLADVYTVSANLAGIPGLSVPFGRIEEEGVVWPAGVQLLGNDFREPLLFAVGKVLESEQRMRV